MAEQVGLWVLVQLFRVWQFLEHGLADTADVGPCVKQGMDRNGILEEDLQVWSVHLFGEASQADIWLTSFLHKFYTFPSPEVSV
jgi:hypothetical protein